MRAAGVGGVPGESLRRSWGHRLPAPARGWGEEQRRFGRESGDRHEALDPDPGRRWRARRAKGLRRFSTMIIRPPQQGQRRTVEGSL